MTGPVRLGSARLGSARLGSAGGTQAYRSSASRLAMVGLPEACHITLSSK
jgi:hypothetical protein